MKIFIFKPSDRWEYCGGGIVIIAQCLEDCQSMVTSERFFRTQEDVNHTKMKGSSAYNWVLVEAFHTTEKEPRVVLNDYNWG